MKKLMPKTRDQYEWDMLWAFHTGMQNGYAIDHERQSEDEEKFMKEFAERLDFKRKNLL